MLMVYAYDTGMAEKKKHEICKGMIIKCWNGDIECARGSYI